MRMTGELCTIKELAEEALDVQNACNLSGVIHTFSRVLFELREIARAEGWEDTDKINNHPICILFANKISSLTGDYGTTRYGDAYMWAQNQVLPANKMGGRFA